MRAVIAPAREAAAPTFSAEFLAETRRTRRHPRIDQFDYLHLRHLRDDLAVALGSIEHPVADVLDVFCGTRPYDDMLPAGSKSVGLDIDDRWGAADVVSDEFLPFEDESFDLVVCFEAFYYVADPERGASEIRRVLRPGGTVVITVPFVWEYDETILEHRFTAPELRALFAGWDQVEVIENGGRGVAWATLTGRLLVSAQRFVRPRLPAALARALDSTFGAAFAAISFVGALIERLDRRAPSHNRLPMNLMLTARRPTAEREPQS